MKNVIRLATRTSHLALAQAEIVKHRLLNTLGNTVSVEFIPIITQGDRDTTSPLSKIGGKGIFIKEVEYALLEGKADIAVHSLKDITSNLANNLTLSGFLAPESCQDALLFKDQAYDLDNLPKNSTIATGSLRRQALLKYYRPDIQTVQIRGNVLTRLEKLKETDITGLMLSQAGLIRLNITDIPITVLDPNHFIPAPGQGVIALETHCDNPFFIDCCKQISDTRQTIISTTELHFLKGVGLDCKEPLGLYTQYHQDELEMKLFLANQAMTHFLIEHLRFPINQRFEHAEKLTQFALDWLSTHDRTFQ